MKKVVMVISCLLLLASAGLIGMSCDEDNEVEVTWRLASYSMEGTLQTDMLYVFIDKVEDKSDGRMEIQMFSGGSLYQLNEIFDAVSSGAIDLGFTSASAYFAQAPRMASISNYVNCTSTNMQEAIRVLTALVEQSPPIMQDCADNDITPIFFAPTGTLANFYKERVDEMSDNEGMVVGCASGVIPIAQALGTSPKSMEFGDFYMSCQTGVVDGWIVAPLADYLTMGLDDVAPYVVNLNFASGMSFLMNQGSFDDLPEDLQEVVLEAASETQSEWITAVAQSDQDLLQALADDPDVKYVLTLTGAERDLWFETAITPVFYGMMDSYLTPAELADTLALIDSILAS